MAQKMGPLRGLLICLTIVLLAAVSPAVGAAGLPTVTAARVGDHDGVTRFVIDMSVHSPFKVTTNAQPSQVVIDLPEINWQARDVLKGRTVGVLRAYHYETVKPGAGRLLLDVAHPVTVAKAFIMPPADYPTYRLVVDLVGAAGAPPATPPPAAPPPTPSPPAAPQAAASPLPAPAAPAVPAGPPERKSAAGHPLAAGPIPAAVTSMPPAASVAKPADRRIGHPGKPIVVLDPGHGGVDPGATSLGGVYEKSIVLGLAYDVKAALDKTAKVKCVLTREDDRFVALRDRVAIARAAHADLFISLHADSVADPQIRGLSVYTLSQTASDTEAQALADKENKADIVAGLDLSNESPQVTNILIDLVQRESLNLSAVFASVLIHEVSRETKQLLQNTHRFAGFAVLKAPDVPSVLVETGYLSNEQDEQMLRRPEYRAKLAAAVARAIESYFARNQRAAHRQ
jgi:N-acetylmuramoyl-L-alanine amidase